MTGGWRGLAVGALGLTAFYNLVTLAPSAQGGLSTLTGMPGKVAEWLIRPDVPLIPDLAAKKNPIPPSGSWGGGNNNPAQNGGSWGASYQPPAASSGVQTVLADAAQATNVHLQYT